MIFEIPITLTHYTPVVNWLFRMFEGHNDVYTESQLHYKIRYLIKLYAAGENTPKLAHDLSEMECWQTRTLGLSDYKVPEYWDPLYETFQHYKTRMLAENRLIKSFYLKGKVSPCLNLVTELACYCVFSVLAILIFRVKFYNFLQ